MRVTSPRREARRPGERRPPAQEIDEQTRLGEVYMPSLIQPSCGSLAVLLGVALVVLGAAVLFVLVPATRDVVLGPIPLPWLLLGVLVYPVVFVAARIYVRQAERIEREFTDLVGRSEHRPAGILAIALVCVVTLVAGACGLRLSRTTSDFYVASRGVSAGWNASAISGEYLSAASFLGVAGLVYALGADMLWFPVGYTVGYLVLLVLVAAPLRRSGAYTLPDFAETRLESRRVRALASLLVVGIGWLYLLPQFQGAGLALSTVTGAPPAVGSLIVAVVVLANVAAGGMRSITLVQAFQYWLKLTAICHPRLRPPRAVVAERRIGPDVASPGGAEWAQALSGFGGREHPLYATYSLILALCFGTMGLPHVLVRFYTNPDGRAARRTTLVVVGAARHLLPLPAGLRRARPGVPADAAGGQPRRHGRFSLLPAVVAPEPSASCCPRCWPAARSRRSCRPPRA